VSVRTGLVVGRDLTWQAGRQAGRQLARVTMPAAWQLEQKVPVRREKELNEEKEFFFFLFFSHRLCVLVVLIIMGYFSHQNPLVRVS